MYVTFMEIPVTQYIKQTDKKRAIVATCMQVPRSLVQSVNRPI